MKACGATKLFTEWKTAWSSNCLHEDAMGFLSGKKAMETVKGKGE